MPEWIRADHTARTVTIDLTAGSTNANNYWNFNGYVNGGATITVPEGYAVTLRFRNSDPAMAHSVAILPQVGGYQAAFTAGVQPVFPGAMTPNATDLAGATAPGAEATIRFTASQVGEYGLVCLVPGHAAVGMWVRFSVSLGGRPGVTTG
jgi:plastocyanin